MWSTSLVSPTPSPVPCRPPHPSLSLSLLPSSVPDAQRPREEGLRFGALIGGKAVPPNCTHVNGVHGDVRL